MPTSSSSSIARARASRCRERQVGANGFGELPADRVERIERGERVLEDRADFAAAHLAHFVIRQIVDAAAAKPDLARAIRPGGSMSPITAAPVSDLPAPDSPTTPSTSPGAISNEMPWTARSVPCRVGNSTHRFVDGEQRLGRDCRHRHSAQLRVERIAQPVAEQIDREHHDHERRAREDRDPPLARKQEIVARRGSACRATAPSAARRRRGTTASPR